jgi:plastocyanin
MRRQLIAALSLLLAAAVVAGESRGVIHGRVVLPRPHDAPAARPETRALGARTPRRPADRRQSVAYIDYRGPTVPVEPMARAAIDQRGETFVPRVLAITVGTTVDFPNSDSIYHNVFSLSKVRRFDLGRYAAGQSRSVRFDRPGLVRVFCDIHSHMSAFIHVFAHPYFAVTDADGAFRIDDVPAGSHEVRLWNESFDTESRRVTVPDAGGRTEVDFILGDAAVP